MISWIVATHDATVLEANLLATLQPGQGDEVVVVENAPSIAQAYTDGQARATQPVRCYVHHDVQILDNARLRSGLRTRVGDDVGLVGLIGSADPVVPWWDGQTLGSVVDARMGVLDFGLGGACSFLDGLLLATVHHIAWDLSFPGWHLYDHDVCMQQLAAGRPNWVLTGGKDMVRHNTAGPASVAQLQGWGAGVDRFNKKWGAMTEEDEKPEPEPIVNRWELRITAEAEVIKAPKSEVEE